MPKSNLALAGLPIGLPDNVYATWVAVLADIQSTGDARHAAERYQFLCGFAQALVDAHMVNETGYADMRTKLLATWADTVNRVAQDAEDSIVPIDHTSRS
ncbi:hypothetical protein [Pseudomonas sp. LS-2]|uniref:hypothetical protein n=1 Tax=Pseudomonas sp. LS-2 TaxID=2315859 RepID=UPI000E7463FF|nr:hypothetical protein [Pseudomonas sp. LS-2]RJX81246.1 hypothetical protein D3M70_08850 [Pseudomonas sp. LS-2]